MVKKPETKLPLRELVRRINTNMKFDAIKIASDTNTSFIYRRPCGVFSIDLATGGGLPAGTTVEIAGPEGAGKNLIADLYIAKAQEIFGEELNVCILTGEYGYDKLRARQNGVQIALTKEELKELELAQESPLSEGETKALQTQIGEFFLIDEGTSERKLDSLLTMLKTGELHMVLIDSLPTLIPSNEADKSLDENSQMAARATLITRFMLQATPLIGKSEARTLMLLINQVRAPIGYVGNYVPEYKVSEPCAVKHLIAGRLEISSGRVIKDENKNKIGKELRWLISKGKTGFHEGPAGILQYSYDTGIDLEDDFANTIASYCERAGAWYTVPFGEPKDQKFQGKQAIMDEALANPAWVDSVKKAIYEIKGVRFLYRDNEEKDSGEGRKENSKGRKRKSNS